MFETLSDIHTKYDGEWVYLIRCTETESGDLMGGEVVLHSRNRDDVIRAMPQYEEQEKSLTCFLYAGKIPQGVQVIL